MGFKFLNLNLWWNMELTEPIYILNDRLTEYFGITIEGLPIFRIVWSDSQYEMRKTEFSDTGLFLLTPQVRLMPKYPWIKHMFILERLVAVPEMNREELADAKISYEPIWVFMNDHGDAVPPVWVAIEFIINTLHAALGKKSLVKYIDEEALHPEEVREKRIEKLQEELFGDESSLLGRTITGEAIVVPGPKEIQ